MGMATRKDAMALTREALIGAGITAFAAEGLDASLDGICERAGYTRGAFYVHFRDRDDFLVAVMDRVGELFLSALFQSGTLPATVERFVAAIASGEYPLTPAGGVRPHQLLEACARSPRVRERYVALIATSLEQLAAMVARGQAGTPGDGARGQATALRDDVAADETASLLMAIVIGAQTMMELGVPLDPPRLARAVLALLAPPTASGKPRATRSHTASTRAPSPRPRRRR